MATSSHSNPGSAPDEASSTPQAITPLAPDASAPPTGPARSGPSATAMAASSPSTAPQPAVVGRDRNGATGATRAKALSSTEHVVELADSVVRIADQLHERVLQEILSYEGRIMPDAQQATMRTLMDDELLLRQRAQALYADAARLVILGLAQPQRRLMALTAVAAEKIRHIGVIGEATGLVGAILSLVGGIATGQLSQVETAFEKIQLHNTALKSLKPTPPVKT
ncbi:hypothetical protein AB2N08_16590 [Massilia aurea]|uniref:hypothetical protein n=1 Tax=Massilia aurea TaxID=373040 RepID=UPI003461AA06